jgi:hypothetical protein
MKNVEPSGDATPADWTVREGMDVLSTDGEKLGEVANATGIYVLVRHGFLFAKEYYVPADAIANVGNDAVYLTMTREIALEQQWDKPPTANSDHPATPAVVTVVTGDPAAIAATTSEPASGTYVDDRSGVQTIDQEDEATAISDAEITGDAHRELASEIGIPVPDDENLVDPLSNDEPEEADEPVPADGNPNSGPSGSRHITPDEQDLVVDDDGVVEAERSDRV